jgi:hypothetical protein
VRGVDDRLTWFLSNKPAAAGRCAEHTMHALDIPRQGLPDATAVARLVMQDRNMRQGPCPRGAMRYWVGGSDGHGHVGIEQASIDLPAAVASTDVGGPRTVGVRELAWFARQWPALRYVGWSWYFGAHNTQPKEDPPVTPPPAYRNIKVATRQVIPFNTWTTIDLGPVDAITPPVGSNDWWVQVHLSLQTSTGPRNDLRYVKGRWARKIDGAPDDTHGTDTKSISADIPKDSWQGAWGTDMKGLAGVPVEFQVYVGSMTAKGSVVSPMRLFTVEDENT